MVKRSRELLDHNLDYPVRLEPGYKEVERSAYDGQKTHAAREGRIEGSLAEAVQFLIHSEELVRPGARCE